MGAKFPRKYGSEDKFKRAQISWDTKTNYNFWGQKYKYNKYRYNLFNWDPAGGGEVQIFNQVQTRIPAFGGSPLQIPYMSLLVLTRGPAQFVPFAPPPSGWLWLGESGSTLFQENLIN